MAKKKYSQEVKITSFSPEANYYRNKRRSKVDKLFYLKNAQRDNKLKRKFDYLARQLWRDIVTKANKL